MSTNQRVVLIVGIIVVGLSVYALSVRESYVVCRLTGTWHHCLGYVTGVIGVE